MNKHFLGGGTFYKLNSSTGNKLKIHYIQSTVPNYIPDVELYMKNDKDYTIPNKMNFKKALEDKYKVIEYDIEEVTYELLSFLEKINWNHVYEQERNSNDLDGLNWDFYIKIDDIEYEISGYENFPSEIKIIVQYLKRIKDTNIGIIQKNNHDKRIIEENKGKNINFMTFLNKKGILSDKDLENFTNTYDE